MPRFRRLFPVLVGGAAETPITYLFQDQFTTPDDAPVTSPRTCEPGPGTLTITDTGNRLSIAGGKLVIGGGTSAFAIVGDAQTRAAGLAFACKAARPVGTSSGMRIGFGADARSAGHALNAARYLDGVYLANAANGFVGYIHNFPAVERYITVLRAAGSFLIAQIGGYSYLLMVDNRVTDATPAPRIANENTNTFVSDVDDAEIIQLDGTWATATGLAEAISASPSNGDTLDALSSSNIIEFTWTPAAGETLELSWHYTDDNNRYYVSCSQAANTMRLYKVEGGSSSEIRNSKAISWSVGKKHRIIIIHDNGFLRTAQQYPADVANYVLAHLWTDGSQTNTFNLSERTVKVSGFATGENLIIWPRRLTMPAPWNTTNQIEWMSLGDSKTNAGGWQDELNTLLRAADTHYWTETARRGTDGQDVSEEAPLIANYMAGIIEHPSRILVNFGTNDALSLPDETTWKANYRTIIDALHAHSPAAPIYLARPVVLDNVPPSTPQAACATMWEWIDDLIAEYAFVYAGPHETDLEGGDSYVTNLVDRSHYTAAGKSALATLWKTALGY